MIKTVETQKNIPFVKRDFITKVLLYDSDTNETTEELFYGKVQKKDIPTNRKKIVEFIYIPTKLVTTLHAIREIAELDTNN